MGASMGWGGCMTAVITTVIDIRNDVRWLKRAVQALLDQQGLVVEPEDETD
jgi:hypothetical protein